MASKEGCENLKLDGVLYCPDITTNLISLPQMTKQGCDIEMTMNHITVYAKGKIVVEGTRDKAGIYTLTSHFIRPKEDSIALFHMIGSLETMHELHNRLGHIQPRVIRQMIQQGVVEGLPATAPTTVTWEIPCTICSQGKGTKSPFREANSTTADRIPANLEVGDEVHSDQMGPICLYLPILNLFLYL